MGKWAGEGVQWHPGSQAHPRVTLEAVGMVVTMSLGLPEAGIMDLYIQLVNTIFNKQENKTQTLCGQYHFTYSLDSARGHASRQLPDLSTVPSRLTALSSPPPLPMAPFL